MKCFFFFFFLGRKYKTHTICKYFMAVGWQSYLKKFIWRVWGAKFLFVQNTLSVRFIYIVETARDLCSGDCLFIVSIGLGFE